MTHATCWCTGGLNINFDLRDRSGSHALRHWHSKHRVWHCGVSFFGSSCYDGPPLPWNGIQETTSRLSLYHKRRPSNSLLNIGKESIHHFSCHLRHAWGYGGPILFNPGPHGDYCVIGGGGCLLKGSLKGLARVCA